jgi:hypothetical protein
LGGITQRHDFRVSGRVVAGNWAVKTAADHFPIFDHHRPNWNFPYPFGEGCLRKGEAHKVFVAFNQDFAKVLIF